MMANFKKNIIKGSYYPPGDKSISHRIIILGSQALGKSVVSNLLEGEDVLNTIKAMKDLGAKIFNLWITTWLIVSTKKKIKFW